MPTILPEPDELEAVVRAAGSAVVKMLCVLPWNSTKGPIALAVVRNEKHRLPEFLKYHRSLGFERFVFIDNASDDGSLEYLMQQCDTCVFATSDPFHWTTKHGWIMQVIERLGREHWYALLDADEHLVFPHCEKRTVHDLVSVLEDRGMQRARACLVDMYSQKAVFAQNSKEGGFAESYAYFDTDSYSEHRNGRLTARTGGPRGRMAADLGWQHSPALTKYPLFQLGRGEVAYNPHLIWPPLDVPEDPCWLALKHYKFDAALSAKIASALETKAYWNDSAEYALYSDWKEQFPDQSLLYSGSAKYRVSEDFLACGLIEDLKELAEPLSLSSKLAQARSLSRAKQFEAS